MLDDRTFKNIELPPVSEEGLKNITMGVRKIIPTQSRSNRFRKYTPKKLTDTWEKMNDFERFVLIMLSEFKTLSTPQLQTLFTIPHGRSTVAFSGLISTLKKQYGVPELDPGKLFSTVSRQMVYKKLDKMKKKNVIDCIRARANNIEIDHEAAPSLILSHFFLTEFGAQVLARGSGINRNDVGFVPNYKNYSFGSLLHLTECNDFFVSSIVAAQDMMNNHPAESGVIDIVKWENERMSTHRFDFNPNDAVTFKPDGFMALFSSKSQSFIPYYLEHDVGDSTRTKIVHKAVSYLKFVIHMKQTDKTFRRPILLFVTSSESRVKIHEQAIRSAIKKELASQLDYLNIFGRIAIATSRAINEKSPLGEIWQVIDLQTGEASEKRYNLLSLGWNKEE
jgi:hypothetical protein